VSVLFLLPLLVGLSQPAHAQDTIRFTGLSPEAVSQLPDQYLIQPGDTLWDISSKFLGNSENWPRLWSINEQITNPHWIYPGNRIVFVAGTEIEPPGYSLESGEPYVHEGFVTPTVYFEEGVMECGPDLRFTDHLDTAQYRAPAVLEDSRKIDLLGTVYKARRAALAQGEHDIVYLRLDDPGYAECGDVVSILHRELRRVRHPEGGARYGSMYRVSGEARILFIQDNVATAVLRRSYSEVIRGDLVTVRVPINVELEVDRPHGSLEGVIVARMNENEANLGSQGEVVFLDRGRADGVRVGNSFYVIERKDEYVDRDKEDPDLPPSVIARVVVVRVDENTSTGVIVQAARAVESGQHVTQRLE